jgi:hypothetical protein
MTNQLPARIVDTHVHFWDPAHLTYQWLASLPKINVPFLPQTLDERAGELPIEKTVFVQSFRPTQPQPRDWPRLSGLSRWPGRTAAFRVLSPLLLWNRARRPATTWPGWFNIPTSKAFAA